MTKIAKVESIMEQMEREWPQMTARISEDSTRTI